MTPSPLVEILTFAGCPNAEPTLDLVRRIAADLGVDARIETVDVPDQAAAAATRFLGSPSVRVDGRDVEPDADRRGDYVLSCRVYRTERGLGGLPDERWIRDALAHGVAGGGPPGTEAA